MTFVYVYCIENLINHKQYVGIAVDCQRRWREHETGHGSKILYAAFAKYDIENFSFEVIDILPEDEAKELEVLLILSLDTKCPKGYNLTEGGEGKLGCQHSEETKRKMSESRKGEQNGMYGKKHSTKTKNKISAKAKGRPMSEACRLILLDNGGPKNPRARKVLVNGREYGCIKDAGISEGIKPGTLRSYFSKYAKTNKWPIGWSYLS